MGKISKEKQNDYLAPPKISAVQLRSDSTVLVHEGSVRVHGLVVELAVLVLHGVDDVLPALEGQLDTQLGPPVTPRHHRLHLNKNYLDSFEPCSMQYLYSLLR